MIVCLVLFHGVTVHGLRLNNLSVIADAVIL